ncbi:MAG: FAD-binding protein, partial [Myxococcales bacterium]|nr:FAD-binding protein [Myxococcales bacterium]
MELTNWGRTHTSEVVRVARPTDEPGVRVAVAEAAREGRRIRPIGALHSWSDVAMDDQVALSLDGLTGVRPLPHGRVAVAAGTRLKDLNTALDALGLAMPILGSVAEQSLAGAVSTGTHGSSVHHGNLAYGVRSARLVKADGEVLALASDDPRLDGVRVGLGALGVLTELVVDVVPAFRLAEAATPLPIDEVVEHLPTLARAAPYVKIWWLPHTGMAMVYAGAPTSEDSTYSPTGRWIDEQLVNGAVFAGV